MRSKYNLFLLYNSPCKHLPEHTEIRRVRFPKTIAPAAYAPEQQKMHLSTWRHCYWKFTINGVHAHQLYSFLVNHFSLSPFGGDLFVQAGGSTHTRALFFWCLKLNINDVIVIRQASIRCACLPSTSNTCTLGQLPMYRCQYARVPVAACCFIFTRF